MSISNIQKFTQYLTERPKLLNSLERLQSIDELGKKSVELATALGWPFGEQEAREWIEQFRSSKAPDGELNDLELEALAGGKLTGQTTGGVCTGAGPIAIASPSPPVYAPPPPPGSHHRDNWWDDPNIPRP